MTKLNDKLFGSYLIGKTSNGKPIVQGDFFNGMNNHPDAEKPGRIFLVEQGADPKVYVGHSRLQSNSYIVIPYRKAVHSIALKDAVHADDEE